MDKSITLDVARRTSDLRSPKNGARSMSKGFADRSRWQRWSIIGGLGVIALVVLGMIMPGDGADADKVTDAQAQPEIFEMPQRDYFAMVIPEGTPPAKFEALAKEQCGDRSFCKVLAWTDRARAARALPMSDREVAALAFAYSLNRSNDFEQLVFDCARFPQPDPINCIGD